MEPNDQIAVKLFGWKWISYVGRPTRSTPGYPMMCRVRQFCSPKQLASESWKSYFENNQAADADMTEPLAYCYESSMGPAWPPCFTDDHNARIEMEREIRKRGLWKSYRDKLAKLTDSDFPDCTKACEAALSII